MTEPTLFDVTEPPVVAPRRRVLPVAAKWVKSSTLGKCEDCLAALIEHDGNAPLSRRANLKRTGIDGTDRLYCYAHAARVRDLDDIAARAAGAA